MLRTKFAAALLLLPFIAGCVGRNEFDEVKANQSRLSAQIEDLRKDRDKWQDRYNELTADLKAAQTQAKTAQDELTAARKQLDERQRTLDEAGTKLASAERNAKDLQRQLADMKQRLEAAEAAPTAPPAPAPTAAPAPQPK